MQNAVNSALPSRLPGDITCFWRSKGATTHCSLAKLETVVRRSLHQVSSKMHSSHYYQNQQISVRHRGEDTHDHDHHDQFDQVKPLLFVSCSLSCIIAPYVQICNSVRSRWCCAPMVGAPVVDVGSVHLTKQVRPLVVPATLFGIIANSVARVAGGKFAVAAEPRRSGIVTTRTCVQTRRRSKARINL